MTVERGAKACDTCDGAVEVHGGKTCIYCDDVFCRTCTDNEECGEVCVYCGDWYCTVCSCSQLNVDRACDACSITYPVDPPPTSDVEDDPGPPR